MDNWLNNNSKKIFKIYDYRKTYSQNQNFFLNEDHLNTYGAHEFTFTFVNGFIKDSINSLNILNMLPKLYPKENPLIQIKNSSKLEKINIFYGVESDKVKKNTWSWLGKNIEEGLNIVLENQQPSSKIKIDYYRNPCSKLIFKNNDEIVKVNNDNSFESDLVVGKNTIYIYGDLPDNCFVSKISDVRNLIIKVNNITIY